MRRTIPLAVIGIVALAGCASAGGPDDSAAPTPTADSPAPTVTVTETAEPTPSADPSQSAEAPYRIEDESVLGAYSLDDVPGDEPLVVWASADHTLVHVIGAGSGSQACQPTGESIEVDDGMLEIDFEWEDTTEPVACTADMRIFGWAFPVTGADASITQAVVDEWTDDADDITVEIQPMAETP